mmetsp:Transcript_4663/g.8089  ORF Transcript_4663/g.8089 Transcript_4663/m.8089 type:complete len:252 (-) Transcript_4663:1140-1895(-)
MQLNKNRWEKYHFFESSALPDELANRGFDPDHKFPGYYYRKDGMLLWNAMGDFIADFLTEVYGPVEQQDAAIAADPVLQEWATETTAKDRAAINGFPTEFKDRVTLIKTMQTMWWICSGLHAAVNFPQYDYFSFAPNKPLSMRAGMDQFRAANAADDPDWIYREAVPDFLVTQLGHIITSRALTIPSEKCIDNLSAHYKDVPYGQKSYAKFLQRLDEIGDKIEKRNRKHKRTGEPVYPYLHPSNVPASIDI